MTHDGKEKAAASVLIVEDESILAEDLGLSLENLGYLVRGKVSTGEEAVKLADELRPDLILMDIKLQGDIDGIEAADQIRTRLDIPVVYLTGYGEEDIFDRAKRTEPYGYLGKPVTFLELRSTIETALHRHAADKKVRESEEKYRLLFSKEKDAIALTDASSQDFLDINEAFEELYGYRREEIIGMNATMVSAEPQKTRTTLRAATQPEGTVVPLRWHKTKNGKLVPVEISANAFTLKGRQVVCSIIRDISEREKAEEALRIARDELEQRVADRTKELVAMTEALKASQSTLRLITDSLPVLINYVDSEQRYRFCNKTYELWRGVPREEIEGRHMKEVLGEAAYEVAREYIEAALSGSPVDYEMAATYQDGKEKRLHVIYVPHLDETGETKGFAGLITDITERKRIEEALRKSSDELEQRVIERTAEIAAVNEELKMEIARRKNTEEALRREKDKAESYLDVAGVIIVALDREGRVTLINRKGCEILGYSAHEIIGTRWFDTYAPESDREGIKAGFFRIMAGDIKVAGYFENPVLTSSGQDRLIAWHNTLLTDEDGSIIGTLSSGEDITERKKAEEALKESEEQYRALVETTDTGYVIIDHQGRVLDANAEYVRLTGHENLEEIRGRSVIEWTAERDRERNAREVEKCFKERFVRNLEIDYVGRKGDVIPIEINATEVIVKGYSQIVTLCRDITERKKAENQLKVSLREKEVLLREIHHRVKNNLAVIQSLLRIQSHHAQNAELTRMLETTQHRIRSMALAHELLYQSENLVDIDINRYLGNLLNQLISSFSFIGKRIEIRKEIQEVQLGIDTAVPLGFILTELISNCYKHAFPKSRYGVIDVSVRCPGDKKLELVVKDDGVGIPEGMDFEESSSLGYQLIRIFVKQLNGEIEIFRQEGTEVRINFPTR